MTRPAPADAVAHVPPPTQQQPKSPKPKFVAAVILAALGFGATAAVAIVAYMSGRHVAPWIVPAVWIIGAVTAVNLTIRWIQHKAYAAVMKLRDALAGQQLAEMIQALQKQQQPPPPAETQAEHAPDPIQPPRHERRRLARIRQTK